MFQLTGNGKVKGFISNNIIFPSEVGRQQAIETQLESMASGLIDSSDALVTRLGNYAAKSSNNLMLLEVVLAVINIGILVLILYLVIKILRPINSLTRATSEVRKGNFNISVNTEGKDELATLSESFNSMVSSIRNYVKWQAELKTELQKANDELTKRNRGMDEFINIGAHELKTPIQPILGLSEIISPNLNGEQHEYMKIIRRNARRL